LLLTVIKDNSVKQNQLCLKSTYKKAKWQQLNNQSSSFTESHNQYPIPPTAAILKELKIIYRTSRNLNELPSHSFIFDEQDFEPIKYFNFFPKIKLVLILETWSTSSKIKK
jgi:hypothetical protein